jgi:hypothetical protein
MKWWMIPWLVPLGILGAILAVTVFNSSGGVLMLAGGILLVLLAWSLFSSAGEDPDADVHYWRLSDWSRFR